MTLDPNTNGPILRVVTVGGECFGFDERGQMEHPHKDGTLYKFHVTDLTKNRGKRLISIFSSGDNRERPDYKDRIDVVCLNTIRRAFDSGVLSFDAPYEKDKYKELPLNASDFAQPNVATDGQVCQLIKNEAYWLGFKFSSDIDRHFVRFDLPQDLEYLDVSSDAVRRNVWRLQEEGLLRTSEIPGNALATITLIKEFETRQDLAEQAKGKHLPLQPKIGGVMRTVFISYSWDDDAHVDWVSRLAERLRADGVDVSIDRWATVPGDELPVFMERAIRDNQFVVIVCTPRYKHRSDAREGGVGYEGDIMTAEVMTSQNNRKFIPVLRSGTWSQAAPSWVLGKYYVNLSGDPYSERDYEDLVRTLLDIRETAPPIGQPMATIAPSTNPASKSTLGNSGLKFEDIKITRVIVEDITEPRNDGSSGGALYSIPFALSRKPFADWVDLFIQNWNHPLRFTTMHRPGIARVNGATVTLSGTTIEEVERYHRDTLQLAVAETNRQFREVLLEEEQRRVREEALREQHRKRIEEASKRIKFD